MNAGHRPRSTSWQVLGATVRVSLLRVASNPIMLLRAPLTPLLLMLSFTVAYQVSGQSAVPHEDVVGFLVTGIVATQAWNATIWGSGHALQTEIYAGTIGAVLAAPTPTAPVIVGHGLGNAIRDLPGLAACVAVGLAFGITLDVSDPLAVAVSLLAVWLSALCVGFAFGGLFILSRQANTLANVLQAPIWLLAGFFVPRTALPDGLLPVSDAIPLAHALDALRATSLAGESLAGVVQPLLAAIAGSLPFVLLGTWSLGRVDRAVRRHGTLDLI